MGRNKIMAGPKISRTAKGKKPRYFSDPAIDKLLSITLSLVEELSVTRERLDTLERLLEKEGSVTKDKINNYIADDNEALERSTHRKQYIERVFSTIQMELEEATGKDMPQSEEEILKNLS
jgi:hypothetical protein